MVVGEAPGEDEDEAKEPFVGRTGKLVRQMLKAGGIDPSEVYFTNVEKYRPPDNKLKRLREIGKYPFCDIDILWEEINTVRPNCILALGGHALEALTGKCGPNNGISVWRGSILRNFRYDDNKVKVVSSYHPAYILRQESDGGSPVDSSAIAYIQADFIRAIEESKTSDLILPVRDLEVCLSYDQAYKFLKKEYKGHKKPSVDIESTKGACIPTCVGIAFNPYHGMSFPLLNVGDLKIPPIELAKIAKLLAEFFLIPDLDMMGQNIKYDWKKLYQTYRFKMPHKIYFDMGMCAHVLYPEFPKSQAFLTSVWTREPFYKHELKMFDPQHDSFIETIMPYNVKDCCVLYEIYEKMLVELEEQGLHDFFFNEIMPLEWVYREIDMQGINFDKVMQKQLHDRWETRRKELTQQLWDKIGYKVNFGSWQAVKRLLKDIGLPERKDTKEDTLVALLANHAKGDEKKEFVLGGICDIRKINRTVTMLQAETDYDGRMRTIFNPNATGTGRTGCNILTPPDRPTQVGFQGQNVTKHGEIGPEIRKCFIADRGKILGQADSSQGEARIVAHLARDTYHLDLLRRKKDFYKIIASWYFGGDLSDPEDPILPDPKNMRFIGKTSKLSLNYNVKKGTLTKSINTNARKFGFSVNVSEREVAGFISIFMRNSPNISGVFWAEVLQAYKSNNKTLVSASGRKRTFRGYYDPNLYYSYIPQSSLSDNTKFAIRRIKERIPGIEIWLECHDAINWQCEPVVFNEYAEIIREEMQSPIRLDRCSLPREPFVIPCDIEIGENYGEMEKWNG